MDMLLVPLEGGGERTINDIAETFFLALGAKIEQSSADSLDAIVAHPDGFTTRVQMKWGGCEKKRMEMFRSKGDKLLFQLGHQMLLAYDFGRGGSTPFFFDGQMMPRPLRLRPMEPPQLTLPAFRLDSGIKRKASAAI